MSAIAESSTKGRVERKSQAELIYEMQQRRKTRFIMGVNVSWVVLLLSLLFLFSGIHFNVLGLEIKTIQLDADFIQTYIGYIAGGAGLTILLAFLSISLATMLALLGALGRLSKFPPAYALATFYVSLIRGTPLLLQIIFFFLALPQLGIVLRGFWAGVLALGLNYGAYMTEIMRAGIQSVGIGQREAALAIGMGPSQIMRRVVLPQALRVVIPPIGNEFIAMLKDTALISVTGFAWEILWRAQKVGRANFRSLEALLIAAIFYWIMTIIFSAVQSRLETHLARGERVAA
ncbi:MAG: amino acid ABC transporter permease [Chloroflexi bacterium]|nr:amino acid ABC transporter permease [Chloroflexota bacterium]MCI0575625.1 amino acid ABC transporter permease [Chloroflexota bacterium]MCI0648623.1 amino acid ABC transporter permease [Chloroflexota bacterium]MCI0728154.1 amino acid ABC transporter permease [Chloroflexota bacterium]